MSKRKNDEINENIDEINTQLKKIKINENCFKIYFENCIERINLISYGLGSKQTLEEAYNDYTNYIDLKNEISTFISTFINLYQKNLNDIKNNTYKQEIFVSLLQIVYKIDNFVITNCIQCNVIQM